MGSSPPSSLAPDTLTRHGWTGHEHADQVGVIQMGGRLYDAEAGRFVQADPFVQNLFDGADRKL